MPDVTERQRTRPACNVAPALYVYIDALPNETTDAGVSDFRHPGRNANTTLWHRWQHRFHGDHLTRFQQSEGHVGLPARPRRPPVCASAVLRDLYDTPRTTRTRVSNDSRPTTRV